MKRMVLVLIAALLLVGCGGKEAGAPQVQLDARAQQPSAPVAHAPQTAAPAPTDAPAQPTDVPAETAEAPAPTDAPQEAGFVAVLTARWAEEGLLEGLYPMAKEDILDWYGIDLNACKGGAAFGDATGGYAIEVVAVEGEKAVLDEAEALLQDHLQAVKAQFRDYDPAALALAEKAVLVREGDTLLFAISPDAERMLAVYRALMA